MSDEKAKGAKEPDAQEDAWRYGIGHEETTIERIAEEDGRYSDFVAVQGFSEEEDYYVEGHPDDGDVILVHTRTHEMFGVDVQVSLYRTGDTWYAPSDTSEEAVAQRERQEKRKADAAKLAEAAKKMRDPQTEQPSSGYL